jgi:hypothetical protein
MMQIKRLARRASGLFPGEDLEPGDAEHVDGSILRAKEAGTKERRYSWVRQDTLSGEMFFGMNDLSKNTPDKDRTKTDTFKGHGASKAMRPPSEDQVTFIPWFIILEFSHLRQCLDILVLLAIMYSAIVTPYLVAFEEDAHAYRALIRAALCCIDLVANFFTAYVNKEFQPIYNYKIIRKRYLRGYFCMDLISSIPWSFFSREAAFLELFRCCSAPTIMRRLLKSFHILDGVKRLAGWGIFKLFLFLSVYLHWVACLWYYEARLGWYKNAIAKYPELQDIHPYYMSLQASLQLTVGASALGDVWPTSTAEARCGS